jgi:hypothetical protein
VEYEKKDVAAKFNIPVSTVSTILKKKAEIITSIALDALRLFMYYSVENESHLNLSLTFVEQCTNKRQSLILFPAKIINHVILLIKQLISTNFWCLFGRYLEVAISRILFVTDASSTYRGSTVFPKFKYRIKGDCHFKRTVVANGLRAIF